jgi:hypothetical protein
VPPLWIRDQNLNRSRERHGIARGRENARLAVANHARHPAISAGHDRTAERLRFQQDEAIGLVHCRPEEHIGRLVKLGETGAVVDLSMEPNPGAETREEPFDLATCIPVPDDVEGPISFAEPVEGLGEASIRSELVSVTHHRDGEKP